MRDSSVERGVLETIWTERYPEGVKGRVEIPDMMYHDVVFKSFKDRGSVTGAIFLGSTYSNSGLLYHSLRVASFLRSMGIGPRSRVGLVLPNSPQFVVSYLGILATGATVVPMNPLYKASELNYIIRRSRLESIVVLDLFYDEVRRALEGTDVRFSIITNVADMLPPLKRTLGRTLRRVPTADVPPDRNLFKFTQVMRSKPMDPEEVYSGDPDETIAAICFTSGTTGLPKGAMLSHKNLVSDVHQSYEFAKSFLSDNERVLAVLPFFHIYGQTAIMGFSLMHGHTLVIIPRPDLRTVLESIGRFKVSVVFGVPSLYNALINLPSFDREKFSSVKLCISGADKLHPEIAKRFEETTGLKIIEGYGLTETSPVTHLNPPNAPRIGSIGLPLPNTYAWIVREEGEEFLPIGEVGEIVVSGPQVMKGYLDDPDADKHVFLQKMGMKWIRTGDIGRMDEDGFFYVLERRKDLIKYKGWSIYPTEIENIILRHEAVRSAALVGVPDVNVGERVVLFLTLKPEYGGRINEVWFLEWCRSNLPAFAVPSKIYFKDELPVSVTGKVMRRLLREEAIMMESGKD